MGRILNTPPVNLSRIGILPEVAELLRAISRTITRSFRFSRLDNKLFLAMADPLNVLAIDDVKRITRLDVVPMISSERAILDKLNNIDAAKSGQHGRHHQHAQRQADDDSDADNLEVSKETMEESISTNSPPPAKKLRSSKLANLILVQAIKDRASDIHIEPFEKMVRPVTRLMARCWMSPRRPKQMQLALASR